VLAPLPLRVPHPVQLPALLIAAPRNG